jgi:hypothetical protein
MAALYNINMENHFYLIVSVYLPVPSKKGPHNSRRDKQGKNSIKLYEVNWSNQVSNCQNCPGCHLGSIQLCVMLFPEEWVEDSGCLNGLLSIVAGLRNGGCVG